MESKKKEYKEQILTLEGISIGQLKNKLRQLRSIPIIRLNAMEQLWRNERRAK